MNQRVGESLLSNAIDELFVYIIDRLLPIAGKRGSFSDNRCEYHKVYHKAKLIVNVANIVADMARVAMKEDECWAMGLNLSYSIVKSQAPK